MHEKAETDQKPVYSGGAWYPWSASSPGICGVKSGRIETYAFVGTRTTPELPIPHQLCAAETPGFNHGEEAARAARPLKEGDGDQSQVERVFDWRPLKRGR